MSLSQPGVLGPVPAAGRALSYDLRARADPRPALARLCARFDCAGGTIGVGLPLTLALGAKIPGLRAFPAVSGKGCSFPSTQHALWAYLGADNESDLHDHAYELCALLGDDFVVAEELSTFRYRGGRDLTGYEDGTENPKDDLAVAAAIISGAGNGLDGGSFVAAQKYIHDLQGFKKLSPDAGDAIIGRHHISNEELPKASASAHVKRAAQESFDPPAFMVRRSMPWGGAIEHGLYFVAYGESFGRFERVLSRMAGLEDGIVDGLLGYTHAVTGGYYFCPPVRDGKLDGSALGV